MIKYVPLKLVYIQILTKTKKNHEIKIHVHASEFDETNQSVTIDRRIYMTYEIFDMHMYLFWAKLSVIL